MWLFIYYAENGYLYSNSYNLIYTLWIYASNSILELFWLYDLETQYLYILRCSIFLLHELCNMVHENIDGIICIWCLFYSYIILSNNKNIKLQIASICNCMIDYIFNKYYYTLFPPHEPFSFMHVNNLVWVSIGSPGLYRYLKSV